MSQLIFTDSFKPKTLPVLHLMSHNQEKPMQEFQVTIYPLKDKSFITSYTHPLTKRKVRQNFSSRQEAQRYAQNIEIKYKKKKIENYRDLAIEELIVHFCNEQPKNPFTYKKSI
jgi:hypothetical protein